jgi:DNA-binding NarL/FixJ family response regulator
MVECTGPVREGPMPDPDPPPADPPLTVPGGGPPRPALALQGVTILAVEDSRFASDALRLLAQRSGARMRRADSLAAAHRHLLLYRPDVVIVDHGLPDGDGAALIRVLSRQVARIAVFGTSGDPDARKTALAAGAAGFLDKPVGSLAAFQAALLGALPGRAPPGLPAGADPPPPDPLALREDLMQAARLLHGPPEGRGYAAAFVGSVARSAGDAGLVAAHLSDDHAALERLVRHRLREGPGAFAPPAPVRPGSG